MPNLLVYVDNGAGKNRKVMDHFLACIHLLDMITCHHFLRTRKKVYWKLIKDSAEFLQIFGELCSQDSVSDSTAAGLEKFVCSLYGEKHLSSVN